MSLASIVTLVGVFLLLGAVATYLIIISVTLRNVSFNLGTVLIGVRAIADQCQGLDSTVGAIAGDVAAVDQAMAGLVSRGRTTSGRTRSRRR